MPFTGYPLPTTFANGDPVRDVHPAAHNNTNAAVNDLQDQVDDIVAGGVDDAETLDGETKAELRDRATHTGTQSADTVVDGTTNHVFTAADDTKLAGIATAATANSSDATLLARANHTGTESADVLTDGTTNKAFLATERTKLAGVATGATANATDADLRDRTTHTGTQSADSLTDGTTNKAFLATERTKLSGIATAATANDTDANLKARANHTGTESLDVTTDSATRLAMTPAERTKLSTVITGVTLGIADIREAASRPTGALVETVPRGSFAGWGATAALTSQTLQMCFIPIVAGVTYTTAVFRSGTTAMSGGTFQNAGLYDGSLNLLVGSTVLTDATWAASTLKTFTFTAPYVAAYSGFAYLGIVVQASTPPTMSTASGVQGAMALTQVLHGTSTTGIASGVLPSTAAAITAAASPFYAYLT